MTREPLLLSTARQAAEYLDGLDVRPVGATATPGELRTRLGHPLTDLGIPDEQVIGDLIRDSTGGLLGSAGGRFYGWVIGGSLPAALAADWLVSTWDQNAALYACSPAEAIIEEICRVWLVDLLGLPSTAAVALVTGCQTAHTTCLAAARHRQLSALGWDVEVDGLAGAPRLRVLTTAQAHASITRSARLLGLGSGCIRSVAGDDLGRMSPAALGAALAEQSGPTIVILLAGDINTGRYDPFEDLVPMAHDAGAWVHVDGAFGLWAAASPTRRHQLAGVAAADSWATDAHKWLNVPYDSGIAICADPAALTAAMGVRASYLTHAGDQTRDQIDWNPEWSRRGRGVPIYAALRSLGRTGIADLVERTCRAATSLTRQLGALPGAELLADPVVNQGLIRFLDPLEIDHDAWTDHVIGRIQAEGTAWFGGTNWNGMRAMRISVCGWSTTDTDVEQAVAAVARTVASESAIRRAAATTSTSAS
ncbi:MAG TPA: pyridoxal-dependent decarboxylase [Kineosporiaceae bacterium]|nr:pyridoxal-dependent decarboxylase [Kineosporiaceae bacterium]